LIKNINDSKDAVEMGYFVTRTAKDPDEIGKRCKSSA
jgi:hypothetical protein